MSKAHEILTYYNMNLKGKFEFTVHEQSFLGLCTIIFQDQVFFSSKKLGTPLRTYVLE